MDAALLNEPGKKRGRRNAVWAGTAWLLVLVAAVVLIGRIRPLSMNVALAMAGATGAGTLAMAWFMARSNREPAWAWWAAGAVMAAGIVLSVFLVGDPVLWKKDVHVSAWMLPWFLLLMGTTRKPRSADCSPAGARAGWTFVGIGVVLTVILLGLPLIVNRLFG